MNTHFAFTAEQDELRSTVRRFLAERSPEEEVRRLMATDSGSDPAVWSVMADQMGLQGLVIPERFGGSGFGFVDLQIVLEEMGRALLCAPFLSGVLASAALLASQDEAACTEFLPRIASGSAVATLAFDEPGGANGGWLPGNFKTRADEREGAWLVTGEKCFVLDGCQADLLVVAAVTGAGPALFVVEGDADGVSRKAMTTLDETRRQARISFANTPARLVTAPGAGTVEILQRVHSQGLAALAAEMIGGARRMLEMSVSYAQVREQFGRPIGSFQAVKHLCASMLVEVELATSAAYAAGWAEADGSPETHILARVAHATCSDAGVQIARDMIEVHGGIGFTWEHPAHLYYKRAVSSTSLLGQASAHRRELADLLGLRAQPVEEH